MKQIWIATLATMLLPIGCSNNEDQADAYGNFEAIEVMVSAEIQGKINSFEAMEGDRLDEGQLVALIDTTQLHLKKVQVLATMSAMGTKTATLDAQVNASMVQLQNLERELRRTDMLVEGGVATSKQQDDLGGQIDLMKARISATQSQKASVYAEQKTLKIQVEQLDDQIGRCFVRNPMDGVLLTKYKEKGEVAGPGQPLYKMANLDQLILRAYITGSQLSSVKTGSALMVRYDSPDGTEETTGIVSWVSPQAEFTPKIIQTREERVNLVYAIKVLVPNDGQLKIGMPGEVLFQ